MTCKFVPTKQPKRETTLARLTRQAKAIEKLIRAHDKAVGRELAKLHTALNRAFHAGVKEHEKQDELEVLQSDFECLLVGAGAED